MDSFLLFVACGLSFITLVIVIVMAIFLVNLQTALRAFFSDLVELFKALSVLIVEANQGRQPLLKTWDDKYMANEYVREKRLREEASDGLQEVPPKINAPAKGVDFDQGFRDNLG